MVWVTLCSKMLIITKIYTSFTYIGKFESLLIYLFIKLPRHFRRWVSPIKLFMSQIFLHSKNQQKFLNIHQSAAFLQAFLSTLCCYQNKQKENDVHIFFISNKAASKKHVIYKNIKYFFPFICNFNLT